MHSAILPAAEVSLSGRSTAQKHAASVPQFSRFVPKCQGPTFSGSNTSKQLHSATQLARGAVRAPRPRSMRVVRAGADQVCVDATCASKCSTHWRGINSALVVYLQIESTFSKTAAKVSIVDCVSCFHKAHVQVQAGQVCLHLLPTRELCFDRLWR